MIDLVKELSLWLFIQGFCVSLVRPGILIFLALVLVKGWGRGIGLPILFWRPLEPAPGEPPGNTRPAPGQQFLVGVGVGALVWQVLLAGYLFEEFATNYTLDRPPFCEVRGSASRDEGIADYPTGVPDLRFTVLGYQYFFPGSDSQFGHRFRYNPVAFGTLWWYVGSVTLGGLVILVAAWVIAAALAAISRLTVFGPAGMPARPPAPPTHLPRSVWLPAGLAVGMAALSVVTYGWFRLPVAQQTGQVLTGVADWGTASGRKAVLDWRVDLAKRPDAPPVDKPDQTKAADEAKAWFSPYYPVYGAFVLNFGLILVVSVVLMWLPEWLRLFSPAVGILLLLNLLIVASTLSNYFSPVPGEFISLLLFGVAAYSGRAYKLKFPNLVTYYDQPVDLDKFYRERAKIEAAEVRSLPPDPGSPPSATHESLAPDPSPGSVPAVAPPPPTPAPDRTRSSTDGSKQLLASEAVPFGYHQPGREQAPPERPGRVPAAPESPPAPPKGLPKLAIVCASGGGSRAAAWTMKTLIEIERAFAAPGRGRPAVPFPYNVRLVTGASGGMIAAAYYVASLAAPDGPTVQRNPYRGKELTHDQLFDGVCQDFLTPVTHTLVSRDLPSLFSSTHLGTRDRGTRMEEVWKTALHGQLDQTFGAMLPGEDAGWRPSLIFSPMLVEDGRQLFISNLDLARVVRNSARILGETTPPTPLNPPDGDGRRLLSREGVEFFKAFPEAHDFRLATAARMSASFPYILPAAYLPTVPPRRVVDAGYYDNYGVGIAASWLFNHTEWVRAHTSGVVVIQVRDGVSGPSRRREQVPDAFPSPLAFGLHFLTGPPEGLWAFRQAAHTFRNDNLLHLLGQYFAATGFPPTFLSTIGFEFPAGDEVALNFTLTEGEKRLICEAAEGEPFRTQVDALLDWWHA